MKMTVKHSYLVQLANILANPQRIFGGHCSGTTGYKVYMDRNTAKVYLDGFVQAFPSDPKWGEYTQKHDAVYQEAKVRTADELAALPPEQQQEIVSRVAEIDEEYRDVREKEAALETERRKMLDEEVEVDLYTFTPAEVDISGDDSWQLWDILYNGGNGIIREPVTEAAEV